MGSAEFLFLFLTAGALERGHFVVCIMYKKKCDYIWCLIET